MSYFEKLSRKQSAALMSLVAGESVAIAAQGAGVSARQVFRWLQTDYFKAALRAEEASILQTLRLRLSALTDKAIDTLEDCMDHPGERGQNVARLAALSVLEMLLKVREAGILEERLDALESEVFGGNGRKAS